MGDAFKKGITGRLRKKDEQEDQVRKPCFDRRFLWRLDRSGDGEIFKPKTRGHHLEREGKKRIPEKDALCKKNRDLPFVSDKLDKIFWANVEIALGPHGPKTLEIVQPLSWDPRKKIPRLGVP